MIPSAGTSPEKFECEHIGRPRYILWSDTIREPRSPPMSPLHANMPAAVEQPGRRRAIGFLNWAHALDHYVMLIFPTVVIGLEAVYGRSYADLIVLPTASFVAFGVFSLPAGWLADHWSRRNMMAAFYLGCGVSLIAAGLAPTPL